MPSSLLYGDPVNRAHPLVRSMLGFWMRPPGRGTSNTLFDLLGLNHLAVSGAVPDKDGLAFDNSSADSVTSATADNGKWNPASGVPIAGAVLCTPTTTTPGLVAPLMSRRGAATSGWALYMLTTGALRLTAENSTPVTAFSLDTATNVLAVGRRSLVGFRIDTAGGAQIYVDGVSVGISAFASYTPFASTATFQVGGEASNTRAWPGTIDGAWFWRGRHVLQEDFFRLHSEVQRGFPTLLEWDEDFLVPFDPLSPPNSSLLTDLSAYWTLDETSGSRYDSHGSRTLTDNNTVTSATGKLGNAASFASASSEYLSAADSAALSTGDIDWTISCWVKATTLPGAGNYPGIVCKDDGASNREYQLIWNGDGSVFRFNVYDAANTSITAAGFGVQFGSGITTGTWYHLLVWHDAVNNQLGARINGGAATTVATIAAPQNDNSSFCIGRDYSVRFWNGLIDEVGFWKRVLTEAEGDALYNGGAGFAYPFLSPAAPAGFLPAFASGWGW